MNNRLLLVVFFLPLFCLMAWVGLLSYQKDNGIDIKLPIMGYDPRDLLSGHYIQYQIDWNKADCNQFKDHQCHEQDFCKDARWRRQCRFYIPEQYAMQLDRLFWQRNDTTMIFEVVYSYKAGQTAIAKQLLINGKDWRTYVVK